MVDRDPRRARISWVIVGLLLGCGMVPGCVAGHARHVAEAQDLQQRLVTAEQSRIAPPNVKVYEVCKGDGLLAVARRTGVAFSQLAQWNHLALPYTLYVGQRLYLSEPPGWTANPAPHAAAAAGIAAHQVKSAAMLWRWPVRGRIVRGFRQRGSKGIDIAAPQGTKVRSAAAGKVVYSGSGLRAYNNLLIIRHDDEFLSAYGYNRRVYVKEGDLVIAGQNIAEVGAVNGKRTSLHFEIRRHGKPVNPLRYLPAR